MSYFYDVMASFLILLIFGIIFLGLIIAAMAKNIEKNWPKYKCNPIVIPIHRKCAARMAPRTVL